MTDTNDNVSELRRGFIVQQLSNFDYNSALEHCIETVAITVNHFKFDNVENALSRMRKYASTARENDILIVSGHPFLNMLALMAWSERFPTVTTAVFNGKGYTLHQLDTYVE